MRIASVSGSLLKEAMNPFSSSTCKRGEGKVSYEGILLLHSLDKPSVPAWKSLSQRG